MTQVAELPDFPRFREYEDAFVAFVDLLGFKKRVHTIRTQHDFDAVAFVLYTLQKEAESYGTANESYLADLQMTAVSDAVIISIPFRSPVAAFFVVTLIHRLQYDLLALRQLRVPVRGYLARGPIYHRSGLLFGTGYQAAYEGESAGHGPPRIIVAPDIIAQAQELTERHRADGHRSVLELLRQDRDGAYFVDYLKPVGVLEQRPRAELFRAIQEIAAFARAEVVRYASQTSIRAKYEWLADYVETIRRDHYAEP